ncbi:chemotaxis protein [Aetokthonos hydrillicola CCALA 1050]|nr:chemotaxis protein [Aetokthonos hydrillicola CCALA 1050]
MDQSIEALLQMLHSNRSQIFLPQERTNQQQITEEGFQSFKKASSELETLIQDYQEKDKFNVLLGKAKNFVKVLKQVSDLVKANQINEATKLMNSVRIEDIDKLHDEVINQQTMILAKSKEKDKTAESFLNIAIIFGTLISIVSTLGSSLWITLAIDHILQNSASKITASSSQILAAIEQQESVTSQQASSVQETTSTMDELEASFRQSAQQAKAAVAAANKVLDLAENSTQALRENLEGMFNLENKVGRIAQQMIALSEQANQIGSISQLVSELAKQTDILAINSAVEATRAGEHGKGFSIVANEIRRLADQSQRSAEKISTLVSQIQSATNSTVMVTDEGTKTVKTVTQIAQKIDQAFTGVAGSVNEVVLNNQQISLNLKQQLDAIQQVVQAMDAINKGARETAIGIGQTRVGTQHLNIAALELKQMV